MVKSGWGRHILLGISTYLFLMSEAIVLQIAVACTMYNIHHTSQMLWIYHLFVVI